MARDGLDYVRRFPILTQGALLALAFVCISLTLFLHPADGSASIFAPLLFMPLIFAVLTCHVEFVVFLGFLLSLTSIAPIVQAFYSTGGNAFQWVHASEAFTRFLVLNAFAGIGGWYAHQMRGMQDQTARRLKETDNLLNISLWIETSSSLEDAIDIILLALHQIRPYKSASLYFCDEDRTRLVPQGTRSGSGDRLPLREPIDITMAGSFETLNVPTYCSPTKLPPGHPLAQVADGAEYFAAIPLFLSGHRLDGLLYVAFGNSDVLPEEDYQRLEDFSRRIAVPLQKARLEEKLRDMAFTDAMTGLQNYRAFRSQLEEELRRATRYDHPLALLLMDLDNFKKVNDAHGHPVGDRLLAHTAAVLKASLRDTDLPTRYGGEEFAVLCPETDAGDASLVAERIRSAIESSTFYISETETLSVTVSVGIAAYPAVADSEAKLVYQADMALYQAKRDGRNRVRLAIADSNEVAATGHN